MAESFAIHSLRVGQGEIGIARCPALRAAPAGTADSGADLDVALRWGARHVVTLTAPGEPGLPGPEAIGAAARRRGMSWHHVPIPDFGVPGPVALAAWREVSPGLHRALDAGERVLIHCRGGLGRSGMMAALLLIERGEDADVAMGRIRAVRPGAIETVGQERFLAERAAVADRRTALARACLFGVAVGDALGAAAEFLSLEEIRALFPDGVDRILPCKGRAGAITDDTRMTLFTCEGLVRALRRGDADPVPEVHLALLRWLATQGETVPITAGGGGLIDDPRLHARRAPGATCLSALGAAREPGSPAQNGSKGCGTIMRVAPVAFLPRGFDVADIARRTSALTHGLRTGQDAAAAWALILRQVMEGKALEKAAEAAALAVNSETARAIGAALGAPRDGRPETVASLGEGRVAEEALAIALYACLVADTPEDGWRIAVTHSGDSDSTGAIAGALLGMLFPEDVMAHRWRSEVECADLIDRLARELAEVTR